MRDSETSDAELSALAQSLAAMQPLPAPMNRDQVFFRAGQVIGRRASWLWQSCALLLAVLSLVVVSRPRTLVVERIVVVEAPPASTAFTAAVDAKSAGDIRATDTADSQVLHQLKLRDQVLRWGVDALAEPSAPPATLGTLSANELLGRPDRNADRRLPLLDDAY